MRLPVLIVATVGTLALVAVAALAFGLSLERAVLLAPAIVICVGSAMGLVVLWSKAALEPWRRRRATSDAPRSVTRPDDLDDRTLRAERRG